MTQEPQPDLAARFRQNEQASTMTAEIIVDITHSNVDRIFEYSVPEG